MAKKTEVCIITLNWNGGDMTRTCIKLVKKYTSQKLYKMVVVDNGSVDGSQDKIRKEFPDIDLLELKKNFGFSGGNNRAVKYALKEYDPNFYLFLSNDVKVTKNWLDELLESAKEFPNGGIYGPKQFNFEEKIANYAGIMNRFGFLKYINPKKTASVDWLSGALLMVRKEVIKKIGAFDEIYNPAYYEETDWERRCINNGFLVYAVPDSTIYHKEHGSEKSYNFDRYTLYCRNRFIFYWKHYKKFLPMIMLKDFFIGIKNRRIKSIIKGYKEGFRRIRKNDKSM